MALTFGFTGMDPATEAALRAAFEAANKRVGGIWQLVPDSEADHVLVDMDSMYGPMSWLRLHGAGKTVIGLTSAPRTQTHFRLSHPFDVDSVTALLQEIAGGVAVVAPTSVNAAAQTPAQPMAAPAGSTPAPQPQDRLPEELPLRMDEEVRAPSEPSAAVPTSSPVQVDDREPPSAAAGRTVPAAPSIDVSAAAAPVAPIVDVPQPSAPIPVAPPKRVVVEPANVAEWLGSGRVRGRVRFERAGQVLLIDADAREYHGPASLKPLATALTGNTTLDDFKPVPGADWAAASTQAGAAQPLPRLLWYAALIAGQGELMPGFEVDGRYRMLKWPQTEREFPKHFRVATAMMKGPSTLTEIADASGVPLVDVTDFVNANLATGFAEPYREPEPEPESTRTGGLFGRLRGR